MQLDMKRPFITVFACILTMFAWSCDSGELTQVWEASGDYEATLIKSGFNDIVQGTSYRTDGRQSSDQVRMCEIGRITWELPPSTPVLGGPAAIISLVPDSLCHPGTYAITEGSLLTWQAEGADVYNLKALPASGWTVTGTIHVDQYADLDPGDPGRNQQVLSESASGTFALEAHGPDEAVVRLEHGSFKFDIHVQSETYNPF